MRYTFGVGIEFDRSGAPVQAAESVHYIQAATRRASEVFGGCFVTRGDGGWIDPSGKLVVEPAIRITVDVAPYKYPVDTRVDGQRDVKRVNEYAHYLRALFNQSRVIVTRIESSSYFVED
jgi:hypothetical protein